MLPRKYRLVETNSFERAKKKGSVFQSKSFGMSVFKRKDNDVSQFGFIVSTKISKKAVERNKVKRLLRQPLLESLSQIKGGFDVVFLAKKEILKTNKEVLSKEVKGIIKIAKLI